jgi:hypothetical protein
MLLTAGLSKSALACCRCPGRGRTAAVWRGFGWKSSICFALFVAGRVQLDLDARRQLPTHLFGVGVQGVLAEVREEGGGGSEQEEEGEGEPLHMIIKR